ncbi:hypothetical protein FRB93_000655 [Tulasnella sp. JGI-2019a]|nr:hypothetical protein FRB93_000655 [Tulasnella sp. JGI-2019a]
MQIVPHSRQFRIVVTETEQYLTEKVLCDHRTAGAVIGQATRVWSVRALNADGEPTGDPLALKDVWVREGSPREGDIVSAILEQADNDPISATIRAELIAHLINVRAHGDVKILGASDTISRNRRDHIFGLSEDRGYLTLKEDMAQFVTGSSVFSSVGSSGFDRLDRLKHFEANFPTTFSNRVHYRVVYSEVAQVFSQLTTIRDGYRAVAGASRALAALQLLGWVHRDLSMGNVYLSSNGAGKISDLEYARKLIDSNGREDKDLSRTVGTLNTVACEVIEQTYYFDVPGPPTMVEIPKLKYNHLHDAESLWWCMVWLHAAILPEGAPSPLHRLKYLRTGPSGTEPKEWWDLGMLRWDLVKRYQAFEKDWPDKLFDSVLNGVHERFTTQYDRLAGVLVLS